MRFLNLLSYETEASASQDMVTVARSTVSVAVWFGGDVALCALLVLTVLKAWIIVMTCTILLAAGFNLLMYSLRGDWLIALGGSRVVFRAVAAPLIFKGTRDAMTRLSLIALSFSEIRWIGGQNIEIVEAAGKISTHWLVFEVEAAVMKELEESLSRVYSERMSMRKPVQFLLRYDGGRCFLRWDGVKPSLNEFLTVTSSRFPELNATMPSEERIIDARQFAVQPETEREGKIRLLTNLGLGQLILPLLTGRNGMPLKEATTYIAAALRGNQGKPVE
jgi:hypothetical protein